MTPTMTICGDGEDDAGDDDEDGDDVMMLLRGRGVNLGSLLCIPMPDLARNVRCFALFFILLLRNPESVN